MSAWVDPHGSKMTRGTRHGVHRSFKPRRTPSGRRGPARPGLRSRQPRGARTSSRPPGAILEGRSTPDLVRLCDNGGPFFAILSRDSRVRGRPIGSTFAKGAAHAPGSTHPLRGDGTLGGRKDPIFGARTNPISARGRTRPRRRNEPDFDGGPGGPATPRTGPGSPQVSIIPSVPRGVGRGSRGLARRSAPERSRSPRRNEANFGVGTKPIGQHIASVSVIAKGADPTTRGARPHLKD